MTEEQSITPGSSDDEVVMTTRELMEFLSLSRTKIWELTKKEELPATKVGGDYRYVWCEYAMTGLMPQRPATSIWASTCL